MTRILVVDDKEENRYLLRALLEGHGYTVDAARHGAEALVMARATPPRLIISDLLMPVMDGYTLLRHWKADEQLKTIPFVVYTATYTDPKDEKLALDLGADAFILKPAEPEPFMARINDVLAAAEAGAFGEPQRPGGGEVVVIKEYNEALIRKLEEKALQLEQANTALRENELRFVTIFRAAPGSMILSSLPDGKIVEINDRFSLITGYTRAEAIGKNTGDLGMWADPRARGRFLAELAAQGAVTDFEADLNHKSGTIRNGVVSGHVIAIGERPYLLSSFVDNTDRKQAEAALRAANDQLHSLSRQLLDVQETERRAIARELHDDIGQSLTAIKIHLQAVQRFSTPETISTQLADCVVQVDLALDNARALALNLRPPLLDDLGLLPALRWLADQQALHTGLRFTVTVETPETRFDAAVETSCFRITQEALNNVVKHARAHTVTIGVRADDRALHVRVRDDGCGFDVAGARQRALGGSSLGLLGMEERASLLGGGIEWHSSPGEGTEVHFWLPLTRV